MTNIEINKLKVEWYIHGTQGNIKELMNALSANVAEYYIANGHEVKTVAVVKKRKYTKRSAKWKK